MTPQPLPPSHIESITPKGIGVNEFEGGARTVLLDHKSRARALAELHQQVANDLLCAAAGNPRRLEQAKYKGSLDSEIARLVTDIRRSA